jgi:hypothetical protein
MTLFMQPKFLMARSKTEDGHSLEQQLNEQIT